ncbi:MAG: hypothetical protein KJO07_11005 [Deltaproteobacteria bacterium]|nr:hypothetical protein [Deltaproteobacteria bacterium]
MHRLAYLAALAAGVSACGGSGKSLPTEPPREIEEVAGAGFDSPMDGVVSPDGERIFFTAHLEGATAGEPSAGIFAVDIDGGDVELLHGGEPLIDPIGLVISCDGDTLYVADDGTTGTDSEEGHAPIYRIGTAGGELVAMDPTGVGEAAGLGISRDCQRLYVTGYTDSGDPALFSMGLDGTGVEVVFSGAPLQSPSGMYIDEDDVAWVMDQQPSVMAGGALFSISPSGEVAEVVSGLSVSDPAGVSLVAGGKTAVIPSKDAMGMGQLLAVDTDNGDTEIVETPQILEPSGIRTARNAGVMVVIDADGNAVYSAR